MVRTLNFIFKLSCYLFVSKSLAALSMREKMRYELIGFPLSRFARQPLSLCHFLQCMSK